MHCNSHGIQCATFITCRAALNIQLHPKVRCVPKQAGAFTAPVCYVKVPAQICLQVIPEELRCSAYAFDRGIFGLLGAVAAPLVNPHLVNAVQEEHLSMLFMRSEFLMCSKLN